MLHCKANVPKLVVPKWTSALFWPSLVSDFGQFQFFVTEYIEYVKPKNFFVCGSHKESIFAKSPFNCNVLVLRLICCFQCVDAHDVLLNIYNIHILYRNVQNLCFCVQLSFHNVGALFKQKKKSLSWSAICVAFSSFQALTIFSRKMIFADSDFSACQQGR